MRVAVLSDTHSPRFWKSVPPDVRDRLVGVDLILHAGDVCRADTLIELERFAPVRAVLGNNDTSDVASWGAPETLELDLEGVRIAMIHDSGSAQGRAARLRRRFPDAGLVIFGHSHIPWNVAVNGQLAFNPGSPTDKRRQPVATMGLLDIADGVVSTAIVPVGARALPDPPPFRPVWSRFRPNSRPHRTESG